MERDWKPLKPLINSPFWSGNTLRKANHKMISELIQLLRGTFNLNMTKYNALMLYKEDKLDA